jgi:hypothetical protein
LTAGLVAEQRVSGAPWHQLITGPARTDIKMAEDALARLGEQSDEDIDDVVELTCALVNDNWPTITQVGAELVRRRYLDYQAVKALVGGVDDGPQ